MGQRAEVYAYRFDADDPQAKSPRVAPKTTRCSPIPPKRTEGTIQERPQRTSTLANSDT